MLKTIPLRKKQSWQDSLADLITDPQELLTMLQLKPEQVDLSTDVLREFPLRVPRAFVARIEPGNPLDPILLQILPQGKELLQQPGFFPDPLGERGNNPMPGILHKYNGRALLMPTSSCAIHCRYCFRRHFPYTDNRPDKKQWLDSLHYLRRDTSISEVILSGGDPLAISDKYLEWLLEHLSGISHIHRVRIHTRFPVVIPERINQQFCDLLARYPQKFIMVLHCNHAREIGPELATACTMLKAAGIELLNQSVLLRGINDSTETLKALSERLFDCGVLPYYLHLLDKVQGSAHFDLAESEARSLVRELRSQLPGYLVPALVREDAGAPGKTVLA